MSSYRRAKREDFVKPSSKVLSINVGSVTDNFESLQSMCNDKSNELLNSIELNCGEEMSVEFWTEDIPELICISKFTKNEAGMLTYHIDYSSSTF